MKNGKTRISLYSNDGSGGRISFWTDEKSVLKNDSLEERRKLIASAMNSDKVDIRIRKGAVDIRKKLKGIAAGIAVARWLKKNM